MIFFCMQILLGQVSTLMIINIPTFCSFISICCSLLDMPRLTAVVPSSKCHASTCHFLMSLFSSVKHVTLALLRRLDNAVIESQCRKTHDIVTAKEQVCISNVFYRKRNETTRLVTDVMVLLVVLFQNILINEQEYSYSCCACKLI